MKELLNGDVVKDIPDLDFTDRQILAGLLENKPKAQIAREMGRGERWVQTRAKLPHIQAAYNIALEGTTIRSLKYVREKMETVIPEAGDRLSEMVPIALNTIRCVMSGEATGFNVPSRLNAALAVLKLVGVAESSRLVGEERTTSNQGLSDAAAADIRRKILGIPDTAKPETT